MKNKTVIREFVDLNTNDILKVIVFDGRSTITMPSEDITPYVLSGIDNLTRDKNNKLKMIGPNPDKNNYYSQILVNNILVRNYCIITGVRSTGCIDMIAIDPDPEKNKIIIAKNRTIREIATRLGVEEIHELKFFNGKVYGGRIIQFKYSNDGIIEKTHNISYSNEIHINSKWKIKGRVRTCKYGIAVEELERLEPESKLRIPLNITKLERFSGGANHLKITSSLKVLGEGCFAGLQDLYTIRFDYGSVEDIPDYCFKNSTLRKVIFSGSEKTIGKEAFKSTTPIEGVIVTSAEIIGTSAFEETNVTKLIAEKLVCIRSKAFAGCIALHSIRFGDKIETIRESAFEDCWGLTELNLPGSIQYIGSKCFKGCKNLKIVRIPYRHDRKIAADAFDKNTMVVYT